MTEYQKLVERFFALSDGKYRDFHKKLLKDDSIRVIGVRTPLLRAIAKEWKGREKELFSFPDEYYEVTFLKCAVASALPYELFVAEIDDLVCRLDNWATCDCFSPKCLKTHQEDFLPYILRYLQDGRVFVKRFALVTLLHFYMKEKYLPLVFASVKECDGKEYYVMMACAWLIAEVLTKFFEEGVAFLQGTELNSTLHNRAIQKARESFRLNLQQKEQLKALRK